jgi:hypothetical protein
MVYVLYFEMDRMLKSILFGLYSLQIPLYLWMFGSANTVLRKRSQSMGARSQPV